MHTAGKIFVKTYLKAIRDSGIFRSPHEEDPEGDWSTYTVVIFSESKKFTAFKIKDEKEETIFYFLMVFNLLKIIHPFESKKHFRT